MTDQLARWGDQLIPTSADDRCPVCGSRDALSDPKGFARVEGLEDEPVVYCCYGQDQPIYFADLGIASGLRAMIDEIEGRSEPMTVEEFLGGVR